ncbi:MULTISPECIES: amidohydrolase [unclassified Nocardioides]|uniref:amidohydrolase n=1 Tax=unclassified Nocardioides TaxID=2615069 RepID=UPI0006FC3A42|nr:MULTISPECIES: amidohydrolase [unclassified Nocardioides]KQY64676.1 N-acyl-L-amino acid amidohydrolase [Nocardioides sp. Root140]KQZ67343.1 N-acyl-L-amino acid amidohydrolase [Nocardioides sp. Root151]KRF12579.1 N-acyl-L-amino acid amidohydrolase [Nocardioides sp. Soil796]
MSEAHELVATVLEKYAVELLEFRRDLHAHPELSWSEARTTEQVAARLEQAGLRVRRLPRSGLIAEVGESGPVVALRADLDALPVDDRTDDPWRSTVAGVAHACGHDVHTTALVGAGLALAELASRGMLAGRVRLLFQPAEEVMPGGALELLARDALNGVDRVFCLHCDPTVDVGHIGLREGPLTGAADSLDVHLVGKGGHTSRPHLTEDLTFALGKLVTELPAVLSRRLDPRAGVSVVWGLIRAGATHNVIPATGRVAGTVRMLDAVAWAGAEDLVRELIAQIIAPYGVTAEIVYQRGVPPVVNDHEATVALARSVAAVLGPDGALPALQSLGGEDFGWYLERVPGAMGRLGTRTPGGPTYDLHQGDLRIDERAIAIGAAVLVGAALESLV